MTAHYAIFVDLENCGAKVSTLNTILEKVKIRGDILLGKVYGYTDQYADLKEVLLSNTFNVVPSLRFGRNQKNNLDIQLVIDALDVAFRNELIDSFCIVSGDSDYTPLVGKLKSMGKFVLGISRSEAASGIFINACNEFQFLESVTQAKAPGFQASGRMEDPLADAELSKLIQTILAEQADEGELLASELKNVLLRLRPDFTEKSLGFSTFGKLLTGLAQRFGAFQVINDNYNLIVQLRHDREADGKQIDKENMIEAFAAQLGAFKDSGFQRVNPSILKEAIQNQYPNYNERALGFKRFSDLLRHLEKLGLLCIEMDEQKNILVKIP
ncbi:MAG: NYN domain-containing protein [Oscillospiraceae bacterium]|nr:NYN domain-containing protein [Oscillospiraceae bacterium]